jgi:hypothetical protein
MQKGPILEEIWRVNDKLAREMVADPEAYSAPRVKSSFLDG